MLANPQKCHTIRFSLYNPPKLANDSGLEMWFPALITFPCQTAFFVDFLETDFVFLLL